ncbi:MAG: hypothetical protein L6277_05185 [Desulfobacterales bacterium]|nr:hypothetical protein [Pseudomonadota bacterium]MCG2771466.1 hypothetical protein [Desulfobacterales bacterium]
MQKNIKVRVDLSPFEIKQLLSEEEHHKAKQKIESATKSLDELKSVITSSLFLNNSKLRTGNIDYTAFRIETLSLIFEVSLKTFSKSAKSGPKAYDDFLKDLGDEVGLTFARDLVNNLQLKNLFLASQKPKDFIELWTIYENETGAGITKLKKCTDDEICIQLKDNPLRRLESSSHAHCGFYKSYIQSLLNEFYHLRARIIEETMSRTTTETLKVFDIIERPDSEDNCVFIAHLRPEILRSSFKKLHEAYKLFDKFPKDDDFSPCASLARSALVSAQMETVRFSGDRPPSELYKVFKDVILKDDYNILRDIYHTTSKYTHRESSTSEKLSQRRCWEILRDTRRSIYALEFLVISNEQRLELRKTALLNEVPIIEDFVKKSSNLQEEEQQETYLLLNMLREDSLNDEINQSKLFKILKKVSGKAWEIAKPIIIEIGTASIKKEYGL